MSDHIGIEFMRKTRYEYLSEPPQKQGVPMPPLQLPVPSGARLVHLPDPSICHMSSIDLRAAIERRETLRHYKDVPIKMEELTFLLWCTQGVRRISDKGIGFRTVPSAGARHAFETYLLVNRVKGVSAGLYRWAALENVLVEMDASPEIAERVTEGCLRQSHVLTSAVTFVWVAVAERMFWRYTERGYRYMLLDAGHVCQNLYLAAEAIGCGVCAIAAYDDDKLNAAVGVDGERLFAIYAASLGKK